MLEKFIQLAEKQIGTMETPPRSNRTPFGDAYGANGVYWCVIFIWWLFMALKASRLFYGGKRCASCTQLYQWAESVGQTVSAREARRGDILFFNFDNGSSMEHCGVLQQRVIQNGREMFYSIEGNTPIPNTNNDGVAVKQRTLSDIVGVWRPKYEGATDYDGRWSFAAIREALEDGALTGYPDGSFQPDKAVTREELAQFYHNLKQLWRA